MKKEIKIVLPVYKMVYAFAFVVILSLIRGVVFTNEIGLSIEAPFAILTAVFCADTYVQEITSKRSEIHRLYPIKKRICSIIQRIMIQEVFLLLLAVLDYGLFFVFQKPVTHPSTEEDAYKNTELLLSQYTKVMFRIEKNLVDIDYEMYAEEGKHLKEMLYDLVDFDATAEKRRIQEKLLNNDMNLCLLEIMRDSLIALRDYPKNGQLYYRLLKYRYFEAGNTNEDVMLMLDDMPSTTYYRNRKKAIRLYATMLWAFTRPEKIQNKMEEINWKKSGSKVAVN